MQNSIECSVSIQGHRPASNVTGSSAILVHCNYLVYGPASLVMMYVVLDQFPNSVGFWGVRPLPPSNSSMKCPERSPGIQVAQTHYKLRNNVVGKFVKFV